MMPPADGDHSRQVLQPADHVCRCTYCGSSKDTNADGPLLLWHGWVSTSVQDASQLGPAIGIEICQPAANPFTHNNR
jgi:hypothetical protein